MRIPLEAPAGLVGDDTRLAAIRARGGLDVEIDGKTAFSPVERVTTDLAAACGGAAVIAVCTGGTYQAGVARGLAPLMRDGQTVLLIQGNTGGSLAFRRGLDGEGCRAAVDIAVMDNYPYSCWRVSPTRIKPIVTKKGLQIITLSDSDVAKMKQLAKPIIDNAVAEQEKLGHHAREFLAEYMK